MTSEVPKVLIIYYSFTKQTERAARTMAGQLTERGAAVTMSRITERTSRSIQ
jgi:flavodoxin